MKNIKESNAQAPYRVGEWLPSDLKTTNKWIANLKIAAKKENKPYHPVIQDFKDLIENDPELFMLFNLMFTQVPKKYKENPAHDPQVRHYKEALDLMNHIMTNGPDYNTSEVVGFPINAIFDYSMATTAGFAFFLNDKVNAQLKKILNEWGVFLSSKDSLKVLNKNAKSGWLGKDALAKMTEVAGMKFEKAFECNPRAPHYGYTSWDNFFTREFRKGVRKIASPNDDSVIVNACESAPFKLVKGVKLRDKFWIKSQPYSLSHMLADDPLVSKFKGGTIYQAFLSAMSYHRWHSPVSGTIVKAYVKDGTYYSEALSSGFDEGGPNESQGYITEVATRAMIFIEADNPDIGLMCVMPVGMAEVSTCEITVYEGQHVKKGDQLGMFHFGGSTHCLMFRKEVNLKFNLHGQKPNLGAKNIHVLAPIAKVISKKKKAKKRK